VSDVGNHEAEVRTLYQRVLEGWNRRSADDFAAPFAEDGEVVGFDGSQNTGRAEIAAEMGRIFVDHETGTYVGKVRSTAPSAPRQPFSARSPAWCRPESQTSTRSSTPCSRSSLSDKEARGASSCTRTHRRSSTAVLNSPSS